MLKRRAVGAISKHIQSADREDMKKGALSKGMSWCLGGGSVIGEKGRKRTTNGFDNISLTEKRKEEIGRNCQGGSAPKALPLLKSPF